MKTLSITLAAALCAATNAVWSQAFPSRPITFIIGAPAGAGADVNARLIGGEMSKTLGQPIVYEPRAGANNTIATKLVVKAAPDGYTMYFGAVVGAGPIFNKNNAMDATKELVPVSNLVSGAFFVYMRGSLPVSSFQELVSYSKANPGKLNFASASSLNDLFMSVVANRTGLSYTAIRYKGATPLIPALLAGEADISNASLEGYGPHLQSGAIKALFNSSSKRSPYAPTVPTAGELGIKDFAVGYSHGLWAPLATPREIIQRLNTAAVAAMKTTEVVERMRRSNLEPVGSTPAEQLAALEQEARFWTEAARLSKFVPE